jgi:indole-3-glycerol phosphate synthase
MAYDIADSNIANDKAGSINMGKMEQKSEPAFERALKKKGMSFILEVKKASPSKGVIAENFNYLDIAGDYEKAGADCISCLTEPDFFKGSDKIFTDIRKNVAIPMLRKDFTVDEYMIYQAKCMGADCVLLIVSILSDAQLSGYIKLAEKLRISALVEAHDENEIKRALEAGAAIIGVNNRNLKDFSVDISNSLRLRKYVPDNVLFVAESGIKTRQDVVMLEQAEVNGALIGETLMRSEDKGKELGILKGMQ